LNYVIIGNGVAGTTAAGKIREHDSEGQITIISDEEIPFYSRIRLINYLARTAELDGLIIKKMEWYSEHKINLLLNDRAVKIDKAEKKITTTYGKKITYDKLLLATGSNSFVPPIPGADKKGVFTLRRIRDAVAIINYLEDSSKNVVIIGGGLIGLEAGNALRVTGNSITVIEVLPRLLPRQMDPKGSEVLQRQLENLGFSFHIGRMVKEITGDDRVSGVLLDDKTKIECDMILISAGVRSELTLVNQLKLDVDKGVVVDDSLGVKEPDIYCAGDLINHRGRLYGIWPASEKQGEIAGINMASGAVSYQGTTPSNTLKVTGVDLVSIGEIDVKAKFEAIVKKDMANFQYKKLVINNNKIIGAILYGDKRNWKSIQKAIESEKDIGSIKEQLQSWELEAL
jgi:nitrite reductase (NADH) large subunit